MKIQERRKKFSWKQIRDGADEMVPEIQGEEIEKEKGIEEQGRGSEGIERLEPRAATLLLVNVNLVELEKPDKQTSQISKLDLGLRMRMREETSCERRKCMWTTDSSLQERADQLTGS
eukprot:756348-Hanusia_phi.AAC.1